MPDFSNRSTSPEIMDDLRYEGKLMDQTLRELEIINTWLGGNAVTMGAMKNIVKLPIPLNQVISIADLGCGRGDMLFHIAKWANRNGISVKLTGVDANPYIVKLARQHLANHSDIEFRTTNILSEEFSNEAFDVVIGTLFYHHFSNEELITFFSTLKKQARIGFIINDIHRHPLAYHSIRILTQLFSKSSMVQYDAPLSVLRAFRRSELENILKQSGVSNFKIKWCWAFRWQVIVRTDGL